MHTGDQMLAFTRSSRLAARCFSVSRNPEASGAKKQRRKKIKLRGILLLAATKS